MGTLRLILALSVVAGHGAFFRPFFFVTAPAAVICFFVISGFYMALVVDEKYGADWKTFMLNRVLRLYPTYLFFTLLYAAFLAWKGSLNTDPVALALTVTLIGQDWLQCLVTTGVVTRFGTNDIIHVIPIAQAWSIALELQLYLIAAFLFRSPRGILTVLAAGVVLKLILHALGYTGHPLSMALVLNVIVFFGFGGAAYLIYRRINTVPTSVRLAIAAVLIVLILIDCYAFDGFWHPATSFLPLYALYFMVGLLAPFLFSLTKESSIDRMLGDLSYPVYLSHIMVFAWAREFGAGPWLVLTVTLFVSAAVVWLIDKPVSALRSAIGRRSDGRRDRRLDLLGAHHPVETR